MTRAVSVLRWFEWALPYGSKRGCGVGRCSDSVGNEGRETFNHLETHKAVAKPIGLGRILRRDVGIDPGCKKVSAEE